jgi:hypothetical protein
VDRLKQGREHLRPQGQPQLSTIKDSHAAKSSF